MSTVPPISVGCHRLSALALVVTARAVLWFAWLVGLLLGMPRVENIFQRLGLRIPSSTNFVLSLTHGLVPAGLLLILVLIALDGSVSYRLRQNGVRPLWSSLMTIAPIAAIILTAIAVGRPMLLVLEHITK